MEKELEKQKLLKYRRIDRKTKCWIWVVRAKYGSKNARICFNHKVYQLKRVSLWIWKNIDLFSRKPIDNYCGNEKCFNPEHLYESRRWSGFKKLSEKDVKEIRRLWELKLCTQKELGKIYGVSQVNINHTVNYRQWV